MEPGEYILHENSFVSKGKKYCIRERKNSRGKKTKFYLIEIQPFQYISSLFPVTGKTEEYTFDFNKELYYLKLSENLAEIQAL